MPIPELFTPRLHLRFPRLADAPAVERLVSAWEVANTTLNIPHPYPAGGVADWILRLTEEANAAEGGNWHILLVTTGEPIGSVSMRITTRHNHAEIGYWVGLPYWGQGYCTEAVGAVITYGFQTCGLHRIYASHFTRNPASGRVMTKNGMDFEGIRREHYRRGDVYEDIATYGILRRDWLAHLSPSTHHP